MPITVSLFLLKPSSLYNNKFRLSIFASELLYSLQIKVLGTSLSNLNSQYILSKL